MSVKSWEFGLKRLSDLKVMPGNPRTISDSALAALESSIERFGYVEPIVWNKRTGHIVGGHQRFSVLVEKGVEEATVVIVDLEEDEEMTANVSLNNPKIEGTWDDPIVSLLAHIEETDEKLFRALKMDKLKETLEKAIDKPPEATGIEVETDAGDDFDTECPCCSHRWNIESKDVVLE